jgi:uncharacterized protein YchJ
MENSMRVMQVTLTVDVEVFEDEDAAHEVSRFVRNEGNYYGISNPKVKNIYELVQEEE